MSLRLITGAANTGKTGEILGEALAAVAAGASPVIIVPSLADVRRLEAELSGKTPLGIRVAGARQFAHELWAAHGDGRRIIGAQGRDVVLSELVRRGVGGSLARVAGAPGFVRWLGRLVRSASTALSSGDVTGAAAPDLIELLNGYREALEERGFLEEAWALEELALGCPALDGPLGVARFDTIGESQIRFFLGLARRNQVSVALTWESAFLPTRANDDIVAMLAGHAAEHVQLSEGEPQREIERLSRALFRGPAQVPSCGNVVEGRASGLEAECALIAGFVARAIAEGVPPDRVVVAFPDAARRASLLATALRAEQIPAEFDVSLPLADLPLGRALLGLLAVATGSGGRAEAMAFAASAYSGAHQPEVQQLDRRWRLDRVSDSARILDGIGGLVGPGSQARRAVQLARQAAGASLAQGTVQYWQKLADALLATKTVGAAEERADLGALDGAAHQAVARALDEMAAPRVPLAPTEVLRRLRRLEVTPAAGELEGRVQVCGFDAVGSRRFDVVVLGGLTEAETSSVGRAALDEQLQAAGLALSQGPDSDDLARLQFYSLVTRARQRLALVWQEADSEGRETRASSLYLEAIDVYREGNNEDTDVDVGIPLVRVAREDIAALAPALTSDRRSRRRGVAASGFGRPNRAEIASAPGLAAIGRERAYAVTEIETYLACPYRWFYERVVRPEEIDAELDARALGMRAHGVLAAFYRRIAEDCERDRVDPTWRGEALALFDEVAAEYSRGLPRAESLAEVFAEARAVALARKVVSQDAGFLPEFRPAYTELPFGKDSSFEFAGVKLRGTIDRIDTGPVGAFVTDYKLSSRVWGVGQFEGAGLVQAVVYALAASSVLGIPVAGSAYRSLASGKLRGFWRPALLAATPQGMCGDDALGDAEFAELIDRTEGRIAAAVEGMGAGRVPCSPAVEGACKYCGVSSVCEGAMR